jgi:hypothetical protein
MTMNKTTHFIEVHQLNFVFNPSTFDNNDNDNNKFLSYKVANHCACVC